MSNARERAKQSRAAEVAERLKWAMLEVGISAAGLAKLAKVRADAISRLIKPDEKTGKRRVPDLETFPKIAAALPPMTPGWLLFGGGERPALLPVDPKYRDGRRRSDAQPDRAKKAK